MRALVRKKVLCTSIAALDAGMSSEAAVARRNFSFHSGKDNVSVFQLVRTSSSITEVVIEGVTKAVVADLAT